MDNQEEYTLSVGDKVKVLRKTGPNDAGTEVTGVIEMFSSVVTIEGEATAHIKYDDTGDGYYHRLSKIKPIKP